MFSKFLLFILISFTLTWASPVHRDEESPTEANYPTNDAVKEAWENTIIKVSDAVKEILVAFTKQIEQGLNSKELIKSVDHLTEILNKNFNTNKDELPPSEQEIQETVNETIFNICKIYEGIFKSFFQKVEEKINDEELNQSIKHFKNILNKIFDYNSIKKKSRNISMLISEEIDNVTYGELEKIGESLRGMFQDLLVQMLDDSNEEISSEEVKLVENILEEFSNDQKESQQ